MTTNQTIDGVPRELIERVTKPLTIHDDLADRIKARDELRALLDAPESCVHEWESPVLSSMPDYCAKCAIDKPAAQPQGEPVAWLAQAIGRDGEIYRNSASTFQPTMRTIETAWGQSVIDRFTIVVKPLYAEQPAPVAVERPTHANPPTGTEPSGTHHDNDGLDEWRKP